MAGYNLDKSGRSPADEKRLKARRKGQTKKTDISSRSGFSGLKKTDISSKSGFSGLKTRKSKLKFGVGSSKTKDGKANVTKDQLKKTGMSLRQYMNAWNKSDKRPTAGIKAISSSERKILSGKNIPEGKIKKVSSPVRRKLGDISSSERKILSGKNIPEGKIKKVKSPVERKGTPISKEKARKLGLTGDRPLKKGEVRKAVGKTISERRKAELRSRKQPVRAGRVTRGPRSGETLDQAVMRGRVTRGPGSGETLDQAVRAGRVTRGPGSGEILDQPVTAGSKRAALEARGETGATFRKRLRKASGSKKKKAGGGRIKVAGYKAGGMIRDGIALRGLTKGTNR